MATAHSFYLDVPCTSDQPMPPFPRKVIGNTEAYLRCFFRASCRAWHGSWGSHSCLLSLFPNSRREARGCAAPEAVPKDT